MRISGNEIEILIGGKAGEGINRAGQIIAEILSEMGYYVFMIFDHPSLIKGGHNFSIIWLSIKILLNYIKRVLIPIQ